MERKYKWKLFIVLFLCVMILLGLGYLTYLKKSKQEQVIVINTPTPTVETTPTPTPVPTPTPKVIDLESDESIQRLVNRSYPVKADYVPKDLVKVDLPSSKENQLRKEAYDQLVKLFEDAKAQKIYLKVVDGYRSYAEQRSLYFTYEQKFGRAYTEKIDAQPGASEHQLGLAVDIGWENGACELTQCMAKYPEYTWVKEHLHEYGYIVRYPEGKQEITKVIYSPWHIRYLGVEEATLIYQSGLSMEEYYQRGNE